MPTSAPLCTLEEQSMAALVCEICGGKLMAKSGGIFECEFCGMQYDKARIQEMVQEIKGTVKVEGTVEVTGTVKLEGPVEVKGSANVEGLLKRGWMAVEDRQYDEARKCFNQALQMDPECGQAYFGLAMATVEYSTIPRLAEAADFRYKQYIDRARQHPDEKVRAMLQEYDSLREAEKRRKAEQKLREEAAREQRKQAAEAAKEAERKRQEGFRKLAETMKGKIAASNCTTVAVKSDRTVLASGVNDHGQCNVGNWNDIIAVSVAQEQTIGLKSDGNVVAAGNQKTGACDVHYWSNIVKISTSSNHTLGLRSNGRVYCTEPKGWSSNHGQDAVSGWQDVVDIAASDHLSIGIRKDGKLLYAGYMSRYDRRIETLTDFVSADADYDAFIALRSNGTAIGFNPGVNFGLNTDCWTDIVQVAAGYDHVVGLRSDGTVVAEGRAEDGECNVANWRDVVAVAAGFRCTVGLKKDGRLLVAGYTRDGVSQWRLFQNADTFAVEEGKAMAALKEKYAALKEKLNAEKMELYREQSQLKGLFTGKRRKEIETRLYEIETQLKGLL